MSKASLYVFLIGGIFMMLGALLFNETSSHDLQEIAARATAHIALKEEACREALKATGAGAVAGGFTAGYDLYTQEQIGLYRYENGTLVSWNNAREPVETGPARFSASSGLARLNRGLYLYVSDRRGNTVNVAICLIRPQYELQNRYLRNHFEKWTGIPPEVNVDTAGRKGPLVYLGAQPLFAIYGIEKHYAAPFVPDLSFYMFAAGLGMVLLSLLMKVRRGVTGRQVAVMFTLLLLLRWVMIWQQWPSFFYKSFLFDVRLYGNARSFINGYLGDILINAMLLLFFAGAMYFYRPPAGNPRRNFVWPAVLWLLVLFSVHQFNSTIISLVTNSTLNFDFLNIFNIDLPAFAALTALSLNALALFTAVMALCAFFLPASAGKGSWFIAVQALACGILMVLDPGDSFFECFWLLLFSCCIYAGNFFRQKRLALLIGLQVIVMSAITSKILNDHIQRNQAGDLAVLSMKLGEKQDPVLENEFAGIPAEISSDENLRNLIMILPSTSDAIIELLNQKYFNDYFKRYQVELSLFDKNCVPLLPVNNPLLLNEGFFEDQIDLHSDSTFMEGLYFNREYAHNSRYIARIRLRNYRLYVMLQPKQFEELGSLPDLLLDQTQQKHEKLKNFSYAVYRSGQNTSSFGDFNYPLFLPEPSQLAQNSGGQAHHYHRADENTVVIISRAKKTWSYFFTYNSYMLLFYSVITYCGFFLFSLLFTSRFTSASLTRRIQAIIIVLLLLAMSAVGITSARLVTRQFRSENKEQLREKTEIIINELSQFKTELLFDEGQREAVNLKLNEYARLFNTDISLFTKEGFLFTTSQPRLYTLGLAAAVANPRALWQLRNNQSSAVSITERAGSLEYLSLYTPLFDGERKVSGFINLPYFARQNDLVNELSGIISALVNVYVILFVISILAGLILAGYITQPLRLIQQQISNISLGRKNEKIEWQSNDEIGRLISEYNQMLVKLEESASLLAQSERESAWREMARQVAHEIKNPLTPMKLNLQYLQHLMKSDPVDFREKFEKASAGIIEQIDALANIANEFSNFAKLPVAQLETINLAEVIRSSAQLFSNQQNIQIRNRLDEKEILVKGDREQCLRVFNNIFANAIEAVSEVDQPVIEIGRRFSGRAVIIVVRDNGSGISAELRPRIFTPNFTTKSTGSGLGLAMVKNIMQGFGGKIWFESETGLGTAFYLEFALEDQDGTETA